MIDQKRLHNLKQYGDKITAQCPACHECGEDNTGNHLFINNDGVFGCISNQGDEGHSHRQRIYALIGLPVAKDAPQRAVWIAQPYAPAHSPAPPSNPLTWIYRTVDGHVAGYVTRVNRPDGKKDFFPSAWCKDADGNEGWRKKGLAEPHPLYGAHLIAEADTVVICEGEKAADSIRAAGFAAVTWLGGAAKVAKTDYSPLAGKRVVIWPDNDEPGQVAAKWLTRKLGDVLIVQIPPDKPAKWDAADATQPEIIALINGALPPVVAIPIKSYWCGSSKSFLRRLPKGNWGSFSKGCFESMLEIDGFDFSPTKGGVVCSGTHEIVRIQLNDDIHGHGPLCGRHEGLIDELGTRYLVTEGMPLVEPKKGTFPTINRIVSGLLDVSEDTYDQIHTFLGWLKSSVTALREGKFQQQQALAIVGPAGCGKSLLQHQIINACLTGREADAKLVFLEDNQFNSSLFKAEHLFIDDSVAGTSHKERLKFASTLKCYTVGASTASLHAKGRDVINIRPWWRVTMTLNDNPESLLVLPPLNEDVADKIIIIKASSFNFEWSKDLPPNEARTRMIDDIRSEIPAFLWYLLQEYILPDQYVDNDRYNVKTYHNAEISTQLHQMSPEADLHDMLDSVLKEDFYDGLACLSIETITKRLVSAGETRLASNKIAVGRYLARLAKLYPERIRQIRTPTARMWEVKHL